MTEFHPHFPQDTDPAGIYIHVPFCRNRCNYCGFVSYPHQPDLEEGYVNWVIREMELRRNSFALSELLPVIGVDSIYFGGGTPSLVSPGRIDRLIQACRRVFPVARSPEVTIEINPASAGLEDLAYLRQAGVNRASLGIQSLHDDELRIMDRCHTAHDAVGTFHDLRTAGFQNISVDLIAGFPGQTLDSVRRSLCEVLELRPEHVSIYLLEVKTGTPLDSQLREGRLQPLDDDLVATIYEMICATAEEAGYWQYEIANFALNGYRSRHNLKYWRDSIYLGLGAGAHGMTGRSRYANVDDLHEYQRGLSHGRLPTGDLTEMTPEMRFREALIMGLRLVEGIDLDQLGHRYHVDACAFVESTIGDLSDAGIFVLSGSRLALTSHGRLVSNVIFSRWV